MALKLLHCNATIMRSNDLFLLVDFFFFDGYIIQGINSCVDYNNRTLQFCKTSVIKQSSFNFLCKMQLSSTLAQAGDEIEEEEKKENGYSKEEDKEQSITDIIVDHKEWIFGALGLCWAAFNVYQFVTLKRNQLDFSKQLNDTIERVKEIDLNLNRAELLAQQQMRRTQRHELAAAPRRMMRDKNRGSKFFNSGRRHH